MLDIIKDDLVRNCINTISKNEEAVALQSEMYSLLYKLDKKESMTLEESINAYVAKMVELSYFQAVQDFKNLF